MAAKANTVNAVLDAFFKRYVRDKLLTAGQYKRAFNVYVRPRIGTMGIHDVRRGDVVNMLNAIEDENGPVMADRVLGYVRKAFNCSGIQMPLLR